MATLLKLEALLVVARSCESVTGACINTTAQPHHFTVAVHCLPHHHDILLQPKQVIHIAHLRACVSHSSQEQPASRGAEESLLAVLEGVVLISLPRRPALPACLPALANVLRRMLMSFFLEDLLLIWDLLLYHEDTTVAQRGGWW